jgi:hypothetical protein
MEYFGKRLSPLMRFSACNFEERGVSLFLEQVGEMNMMRKNNIIEKERHILRNLKDDDAMFCFALFLLKEWKQWMCIYSA